ncbi:MAG: phenylalanine--tRNA ligase subunit alpha [Candidatus Marinimicrobia bacterium]|jgi:phenylalanyl-tRNA synthetase alpha chain|nr:phenylalanine--tRNA ligase subunit alpha [Candidatus Neomarinimicrobiota bacterium]MBT3960931.1 phenylalanine--tRNA ligase subunit alpha [Candidatus Neomarinimicrobiota bacterium]MBT4384065.1 phenylalanine--tRNA ligase subunit alpha [Candidatus Neomarinimicrobiota bacterium]MBT4637142.1 phenylalanine--tRNA ligase subunit alpha [Candidatus Neomarinimicrobiota bacterium]MBT4684433.1 phenylalanine--tRNA ligase subunit alpha [Candidatus Neomarinimicrobiota bacterium]
MSLKDKIESVRNQFLADIESFPTSQKEIEDLRVTYLGRKGQVASLFSEMGSLSAEERPDAGQWLNQLKTELAKQFESKVDEMDQGSSGNDLFLDPTLPGIAPPLGSMHPLERTLQEIKDIFTSIGFHIAYGPEIDDDYHNFSALNFPEHHPARDMQDTFFVSPDTVLRTHTSNVQIHLMENEDPPIRHIVPGRVYRNEAISFKSYCLFHQVEGIYVDKNVSFGELKGVLEYFVRQMFGPKVKMRFRPSFFPFTEPSAEVDIWSTERNQWLEILGCGMVDPAVFDNVGYDSSIWHGYAFGMGVERIAMLKYKIDDIRHFYQGDIRFLEQFK